MKFSQSRVAAVFSLSAAMLAGLLVLSALPQHAAPQGQSARIVLELDPAQSTVHWTLGTTFHTVHGTFALKKGSVQLDMVTGKASGEIVVDATSGNSENDGRDKKMHKDVLESGRYAEIVFRPDRFAGKIALEGSSTVQLHGTFVLHGREHELTLPVQGQLAGDHWQGRVKFAVPFIDWGLKNPSNFFLKVNHTVDLDVELKGNLQTSGTPQS
jgi:polyisoprenoid-binding protein YceI